MKGLDDHLTGHLALPNRGRVARSKKGQRPGRRGPKSGQRAGRGSTGGPRSIGAAELKAHLLRLLREVAKGQELVITKRGVEVARLVPVTRQPARPLLGRFKGFARITGDIVNTDWSSEWNATR
jgi:prevent-host-death family protein